MLDCPAYGKLPSVAETALLYGITFLFGLCIGSFLNVCIWRIPQDLSIVLPASRCPRCQTPIKPYDNIPVWSWLVLGGKCRACRAPISPLYPVVELLTGMAFVSCMGTFGFAWEALKWAVFLALLIVLFFADIFFRILPDEVNLFGAIAAMVFSIFVPVGDGTAAWLVGRMVSAELHPAAASLGDSLLGASVVTLGLWAVAEIFSHVIGRAAMGFGDVKMMAMMGAFLGIKKSFLTLLLGTLLGSILGTLTVVVLYAIGWKRGVAQRAARRGMGSDSRMRWALARRYQLPLGTFLAAGAAAAVFAADSLLRWYGGLLQ